MPSSSPPLTSGGGGSLCRVAAPRLLPLFLGVFGGAFVSLGVALSGVGTTAAVRWLLRLPGDCCSMPSCVLRYRRQCCTRCSQGRSGARTAQDAADAVGANRGSDARSLRAGHAAASLLGALLAVALQSLVPSSALLAQIWGLAAGATVGFVCPSTVANGSVALQSDGTLMCAENATTFVIDDVARTFVMNSMADVSSVAEQVVKMAESVFPESLGAASVDGDVLSLIVGGLAFGVALTGFAVADTAQDEDEDSHAEALACRVLTWLQKYLPMTVAFMISSVLLQSSPTSSSSDTSDDNTAVAVALALMAVLLLALVLDVVVMIFLAAVFTRCNPFAFLEHLLPAQLLALSSGSSVVALPATVSCVALRSIYPSAPFVLTASSINSDGLAVTHAASTITAMVFANALIASVVSPLPAGAKTAALATTLGAVLGISAGPRAALLAFLAALEWVTGPFVACVNVTNNALVALVIAHYFDPQPEVLAEADPGAPTQQAPVPDLHQQRMLGMIHSENWGFRAVPSSWKHPLSVLSCGAQSTRPLSTGTCAGIELSVEPSEAMDWQFDGFLESRQEERLTNAAIRAAAAGIPVESVDTATSSSVDDIGHGLPLDSSSRRDREPLTMTMSPSATAQFRDPMSTFHNNKGTWPGATTQMPLTTDGQDDMLVDLYYKTPSLWLTTIAGATGFVVGAVLNKYPVSGDVQIWIGLLGSLLIRALECLTLPLIFTSVTKCFANLVVSDKTRSVMPPRSSSSFYGVRTASISLERMTALLTFMNGQVLTAANVTGLPSELQLSLASASGVFPDTQSLVDQIVLFFGGFFTENITSAFVSVQFLGVSIFSMIIGATIMAVYDPASGELNHALVLVHQVHVVLEMILNWFVPYIPLGTLSMMTYSIMTGEISQEAMRNSLYFSLTMIVALLANFFFVACVLYVVLVRRNPLKFTWFLMPGVIFMLATGDYLATIPVLIRSLEKSRQVSRTMAQFTICLGVSLCLCGTAVFFVVAPIFMAYTSGLGDVVTPGRVIGLVVIATASSIGLPLVPGSALTFTCTIWRTLFADQVPGSFVHVVAMEWAMYRLRRTYNIIVAAFIARIIAEQLDESVEDEEDRAYLDQRLGTTQGTK
ncbi:Sodium:dicarboxylate symporter [Phytophthora cactorum]|nr:Sodium:dicarboxylate symporter [Phytophthora cactorum]